jgi:hypothetical protein
MTKTPKTSRASKAKSAAAKRASPTRTAKPRPAPTAALKPDAKPAAAAPNPTASKQSQLIALLQSPTGATIEQMTRATGWQPHTVRGTISGTLRKRMGLVVTCGGDAGAGVYRIVAAA